jgi:hypothetical protein
MKKRIERRKTIDLNKKDGVDFLAKRGLTRDKAMYVTMMIEVRGRLMDMKKLVRDIVVLDDIDGTIFEIGETIDYIYAMNESKANGYGGGDDAA